MSLTKFTENMSIISALPDAPTLTASELKAKFDEAGTKIKTYLNNTLTTETEQLVATEKSTLQGLITALGTQIRNEISAGLQARYHIGKIILDTSNINPYTYLGFGIWELWGKGKVPVGVDTEDTDFSIVEKTGGEKTHTLTINEIPPHGHNMYKAGFSEVGSGNYTSAITGTDSSTGQTGNAGGGQSHNNLQPYITCYMWKRVS